MNMMKYFFLILVLGFSLPALTCCNSNGNKAIVKVDNEIKQSEVKDRDQSILIEEKESLVQNASQEKSFCDSCTIDMYRHIRLKVGSVSKEDLYSFFLCCNKECAGNVEFSEFSSYLVYFLLENKTELTLQVLEGNRQDLPLDYIRGIVENPISDQIDLQNIYNIVDKLNLQNEISREIMESIKIAISKY